MDGSTHPTLPPAVYANFLRVMHRQSEFFLSFGQVQQEGSAHVNLVSSVVVSPMYAKSMLRALEEAVARHEERFGEIPLLDTAAPARGRDAGRCKAGGSG